MSSIGKFRLLREDLQSSHVAACRPAAAYAGALANAGLVIEQLREPAVLTTPSRRRAAAAGSGCRSCCI
jgi:hypothetical protein